MKIKSINKNYNFNNNLKIYRLQNYLAILIGVLALSSTTVITGDEEVPKDTLSITQEIDEETNNNLSLENTYTGHNYVEYDDTLNIETIPSIHEKVPNTTVVEENKIEKKLIALTFDDGPGPYTERLLDILKEHNIKVTFFVLGSNISRYQDTIIRAYEEGHEIAIHGYSHTSFTKMTIGEIEKEITDTQNLLLKLNVIPSDLVRPPYGNITSEIKENLDYPFIMWSVDTEDWKSRNKDTIQEVINANIFEGSIILMHDIHVTTIDAVEEMLPYLTEEYEFVTVSKLFELNEQVLEDNTSYRKVKILKKVEE